MAIYYGVFMVVVGSILWIVLCVYVLSALIWLLRGRNAGSVHVLWFGFALAFYGTVLVALLASMSEAIDATGTPHGFWGRVVIKLMNFMLNLNTDLEVALALLSLVVVPQGLSYVLSGIYGCASQPRLVACFTNIAYWFVLKSFVFVSGVLTAVTLFGVSRGWRGFESEKSLIFLDTALAFLIASFASLYIKFQFREVLEQLPESWVRTIRSTVQIVHQKASRHR